MGLPRAKEARLFYRCAYQRMEEAGILLRAGQTTGAVYLAGYAIECMLKALILAVTRRRETEEILETFRGHRAHDYEWLRGVYRQRRGAPLPREIGPLFTYASRWSTQLRYSPGYISKRDAERFMHTAQSIMEWGDGRL